MSLKILLLAMIISTSSLALADDDDTDSDCDASLCAPDTDYAAVQTAMKETQTAITEATNTAVNDKVDSAFEPSSDGFGSSCLSGLMGLDITTVFVDPTSPYPALLQALQDQIISAACSYVVSEANAKIAEVNTSINEFGDELDDASYGLLGASSKTNTDGSFSYTNKKVSIQDSSALKKAQAAYNSEFKEKVLNGEDVPNSKLDLTGDTYYDKTEQENYDKEDPVTFKAATTKKEAISKVKSALCVLTGCDDDDDDDSSEDSSSDK